MNTTENSEQPTDQQKTLDDMRQLRNHDREHQGSRLEQFNTHAAPLSEQPANVRFTVQHPDGITQAQATNQQEVADMLVAIYGNEPLNGAMPKEKSYSDMLTDEQLAYIMEVEGCSGLEFRDYEEAVKWEQSQNEIEDPWSNNDQNLER